MQVSATLFKNFLSMAAKVANGRIKEIYANVRLKAVDGTATIFASDGSNHLKCSFPVDGDIDVLLPLSKMTSLLAEIGDSDILTMTVEDSRVKVAVGKSLFRIGSADPREFPALEMQLEEYFVVRAAALAEAFRATEHSTDEKSTRYQLGGVYLDLTDNTLECVATDGKRLAAMELTVAGSASSGVIVPTKSIRSIIQFLSAYPDEDVRVTRGSSELGVEVGNIVYKTQLVEGRYPNWRQVMPTLDAFSEVSLNQTEMCSSVRKASILLDNESSGLDMRIRSGGVDLCSRNETGDGNVEVMASYEGDAITVRLDYRYLNDVLKVPHQDEMLVFHIKDSNHPVVVKSGQRFSYVIMPMAKN